MSDRKKVKKKGGSGNRGDGQKNYFCNNNQPNNSSNSHTRKLKELETATYIVSQFSLADQYEKGTE